MVPEKNEAVEKSSRKLIKVRRFECLALLAEGRVLAHVRPQQGGFVVADSPAAVGAQAGVKALPAEGHRRGKVVHALVTENGEKEN